MKRTVTKLFSGGMVLTALLSAACGKLDVVGTESVKSFRALLNNAPREIVSDEMTGGWVLFAPDGSAKFIWSKNYSESPLHDVMIVFEAQPFIDAGLDVNRLPESITVLDDTIIVGTKLGQEVLKYSGEPTPIASYEQIVKLKRSSIGYHGALDHYGVNLAGGNLFEWAKDMNTNDKDMVFVLNPEPFINAGVDPDAVEGWVFAKVTVDDENGKPVEVDKLLKPFNLL
ncbi:MAG: hypothetical protein LBQ44_05100 [Treponema sp.]|jgi:hypothetical protein|nr:hypothetical protein [Treponema sp.]